MYDNQRRQGGGQYDNTNTGMLFNRKKVSAKSPDVGGEIELGGDVLAHILAEARRGGNVKISLIGYRQQFRNNNGTGLKVVALIPRDESQQGGFQRRPDPRNQSYGQPQQGQMFTDQQGGMRQQGQDRYTNRPAPQRDQGGYGQGGGYGGQRNDDLDDEIPF